jgi:hypothetical protein
MDLPEYVTKEEVRRVCQALGISDWTALTEAKVSPEEARIIKDEVGGEAAMISAADFQLGLEIELEHGLMFPDANVTNNHPILTGQIVLAHLKEMLDYYARLEVAELEGDCFKAYLAGDAAKLASEYEELLEARAELARREEEAAEGA